MKGDLLKGHLEMLVLSVVAAEPRHGYAIVEELRVRSGEAFDVPEGTVYPLLHRLERAGLLEGSWDDSTGRRRKSYALTADGMRALVDQRRTWGDFTTAVTAVLQGVPWPRPA